VANDANATTNAATPVSIALRAVDADSNPLMLRIVSRPARGRAGIAGTNATYIPDAGFSGVDTFTFAAWDGSVDSNLATVKISVATAPQPGRVTVARSGSGSGVVTSTPASINCGATCTATMPVGSTLTFRAIADLNSRFDGWSGACSGTGVCAVTVGADTRVTALFIYVPTTYGLTVTNSGTGRGVVKSAPQGIDCGSKCATAFALGTSVTLTATPESTSTFAGWSGACAGTAPCVVSMTRPQTVNATFTKKTTRRRSTGR
jgi:hypothetical protein